MKTYDYNGVRVYLQKEEYRNNGTLAVLMFTEDGEFYGCVTVNLNHPLQSDDMAFLDENNMPGIGRWIKEDIRVLHLSSLHAALADASNDKGLWRNPGAFFLFIN